MNSQANAWDQAVAMPRQGLAGALFPDDAQGVPLQCIDVCVVESCHHISKVNGGLLPFSAKVFDIR